MNTEILCRIGPNRQRHPARATRQRAEGLDRIFITVLGVNGLSRAKLDRLAAQPDALAL